MTDDMGISPDPRRTYVVSLTGAQLTALLRACADADGLDAAQREAGDRARRWTRAFWAAAGERAVKTAAQVALLALGGDQLDVVAVAWPAVLLLALGGAVLSVLTSLASAGVGQSGPSLTTETVTPASDAPAIGTGQPPVPIDPVVHPPGSVPLYTPPEGQGRHFRRDDR